MITNRICEELKRFLGAELVNCYTDTIDYIRPDTYALMKRMGKEAWRAYYQGSIWVNEDKGEIGAGDVVTPLEKESETVERLKSFGCPPEYIHRHTEFNTCHIHISECKVKGRELEFVKIILGR
jgi:hypothetical protein